MGIIGKGGKGLGKLFGGFNEEFGWSCIWEDGSVVFSCGQFSFVGIKREFLALRGKVGSSIEIDLIGIDILLLKKERVLLS